ncbi:MAG: glycosyltransferase [Candidatus Omnitrophota bacterium]
MKICDIVQFYSPLGGGVRRYLEDKMRFFAQRPECNHIVIAPGAAHSRSLRERTAFYEVKSMRLAGSISYRMLLNRRRILSIIDQEKPDLIEVGDPYRSAWIALEAAERNKIPIVAFYHSDFPRALGRTIRRFCGGFIEKILSRGVHRYIVDLYNRMNATIVASSRMERVLKECGVERVVRIPLGTDISFFRPSGEGLSVRRELGLKEEDYLLLFVGRMAREKRIRSLVGMMDELARDPGGPGRCHLLLAGDGESRRYVERIARERKDATWFRYTESIDRLRELYNAADLFVHAGTSETFGITSLEAQACGTRVLAVRNGGLDDSLVGEFPLIMADSPSPIDLADGVRRIRSLADPGSSAARSERIAAHFSIRRTFERITNLYQHILDGKSVESFSASTSDMDAKDEEYYSAILTG